MLNKLLATSCVLVGWWLTAFFSEGVVACSTFAGFVGDSQFCSVRGPSKSYSDMLLVANKYNTRRALFMTEYLAIV